MLIAPPSDHDERPNGTPAYYLGRPAGAWITAMSPRPHRAGTHYLQLTRRPLLRMISIPRPRPGEPLDTVSALPRQRTRADYE
jgi:hypothetical protein